MVRRLEGYIFFMDAQSQICSGPQPLATVRLPAQVPEEAA